MPTEQYDATPTRLQLHDLGYEILPCCGKRPSIVGWNLSHYYQKEISQNRKASPADRLASWTRRFHCAMTTGVRVINGLGVIDFDCNDKAIIAALFEALKKIAPDVARRAPCRMASGSEKLALFVRIEGEQYIRVGTHKYHRPSDPPSIYHHIEMFGGKPYATGKCSRQFAIYGPRTFKVDEEGMSDQDRVESGVASVYQWADGPQLNNTRLSDLPTLTRNQALAFGDAFEAACEAAGWIKIVDSAGGSGEGDDIYDIDRDTTRFDIWHGEAGVTFDELESLVDVRLDLRVSPEFIENETTDRHDRCSVFWSNRHDCAFVKDWKTNARHYPKEFKPIDIEADFGPTLKRVADEQGWTMQAPGQGVMTFAEKIEYLLKHYAHYAFEDKIIDLDTTSAECALKPLGFQRRYRSWYEDVPGPQGGRPKRVYASLCWETSPRRMNVAGVRMRPDQPFPLYEEDGFTFKNTYKKPCHTQEGHGTIQPWLRFMDHLLPDPTEREWFLNRLAHKWQNPAVPGVGVVMVASQYGKPVYGCGRGILFSILSQLFQPAYVKMIDFDVFSGQSSQAQFTDWQANTLILGVSEAKDTVDAGRYTTKRAVFERIKEVIEPRAIRKTVTPKGRPAYTAICYGMVIIFSNHADALQLPTDERRITALCNGDRMPADMAVSLQAWMDDPDNIAALARDLEARDVSAFNVFEPLVTTVKSVMEDLARTEMDDAFEEVENLVTKNGLFTTAQIIKGVAAEMGMSSRIEKIEDAVRRKVKLTARRLNSLRMPRERNRDWILVWRKSDWTDANAEHVTPEQAHKLVGVTDDLVRGIETSNAAEAAEMVGQLLKYPGAQKKED